MSVQAITWVLGDGRRWPGLRGPKNAQRLVLIAVANHASNEDGEAWPSIDLLAHEANCSRDTARDAVAWLVEHGYLEREVNAEPMRKGVKPNRRKNVYRIRWDAETDGRVESAPPPEPMGEGISGTWGGGFPGAAPPAPISTEPSGEPSSPDAAAPGGDERTSGQRANAIMRRMFDGIKERTGREFVGISAVALVTLLRPLLDAGWTDDEVLQGLRDVYAAAAPITRATLEAQMDGRRQSRRGAPSRLDGLAALQFGPDGNLVNQ